MRNILEINKKIHEHGVKSKKLREIYLGDDKLSYDKATELRKQQDEEYKKMMFFKNLKRELEK